MLSRHIESVNVFVNSASTKISLDSLSLLSNWLFIFHKTFLFVTFLSYYNLFLFFNFQIKMKSEK